jgi:hypothetical protein
LSPISAMPQPPAPPRHRTGHLAAHRPKLCQPFRQTAREMARRRGPCYKFRSGTDKAKGQKPCLPRGVPAARRRGVRHARRARALIAGCGGCRTAAPDFYPIQ